MASICGQLFSSGNRGLSFWTGKSPFLYGPSWKAYSQFFFKASSRYRHSSRRRRTSNFRIEHGLNRLVPISVLFTKHGIRRRASDPTDHIAAPQRTEARSALIELKMLEDRFNEEKGKLRLSFPVRQRRIDEPVPSHLPEVELCPPVCPSSTACFKSNQKSQRKVGKQAMRFHSPVSHRVVEYVPVAYVSWSPLVLLATQFGYRHRKGSRACTAYTIILSNQLRRIGMGKKPQYCLQVWGYQSSPGVIGMLWPRPNSCRAFRKRRRFSYMTTAILHGISPRKRCSRWRPA